MRPMDTETLLEEALVTTLQIYMDSDVMLTRWDDIRDKDLMPIVKVKASVADELPGTINHFVGTTYVVDIGVFTSKREDEDGKTANAIRGDVRYCLNQTDIVDQLNIKDGLVVYNNGVMPQGSVDIEDSRNWQRSLTVAVVATTEEIT